MTVDRKAYEKEKHVRGFVEFLADVICGQKEVKHKYVDRFLKIHSPPDADREFRTLESAYRKYYWPRPGDNFEKNADELRAYVSRLGSGDNEAETHRAVNEILWWGAGERKSSLYRANTDWLYIRLRQGESVGPIIDDALSEFRSSNFDFSKFGSGNFRSNAGFTKIYALKDERFVIYDSRVAAALGLLVTKYCEQLSIGQKDVPKELDFAWSRASGKDNRNPSKGSLIFQRCGDQKRHALSNWRANIIIGSAVDLLESKEKLPSWTTEHASAIRSVEAALFMLGKHLSDIDEFNRTYEKARKKQVNQDYVPAKTIAGRSFLYRIDSDCGDVEFWIGSSEARVTLPYEDLQALLEHFVGNGWIQVGTGRESTRALPDPSLGRWLRENVTRTYIASYVAPFLKESKVCLAGKRLRADLKKEGRKATEIRIDWID